MKVVSSDALTKLIQLSKDEFLSKNNTTTVTTSGLKTINGESILGNGNINTSAIKDLSLYQAISELSGTDIVLQDEVVIYTKSVSASTTFTFNVGNLTKTDRAITFELYLTVTADNLTMTFPSSVSWLNGMAPVITTAQKYLFAFRSFDNGATWIGNLQGSFT